MFIETVQQSGIGDQEAKQQSDELDNTESDESNRNSVDNEDIFLSDEENLDTIEDKHDTVDVEGKMPCPYIDTIIEFLVLFTTISCVPIIWSHLA